MGLLKKSSRSEGKNRKLVHKLIIASSLTFYFLFSYVILVRIFVFRLKYMLTSILNDFISFLSVYQVGVKNVILVSVILVSISVPVYLVITSILRIKKLEDREIMLLRRNAVLMKKDLREIKKIINGGHESYFLDSYMY